MNCESKKITFEIPPDFVGAEVLAGASLKLQGANTFPAWVSEPTDDWAAETGGIFGNTVARPNPEHYSAMVAGGEE